MEFVCDFCQSSFKGKGYLLRHMERYHLKFTCSSCNTIYRQKRNFLDHLRSHFEKFICNYCGIEIFKLERLEQHILSIHEPFKRKFPFQCRHCVRKFPNAIFRNCHERDVHKGRIENIFKCKQCDQEFLKKDQLRLHTLENHHKGSIFFCPYKECDRYFKTSKLLRIHEKIHGPASYQCKQCHKSFQQSSNYSKHKKRCKGSKEVKDYTEEEQEVIANIARTQFIKFGGKMKSNESPQSDSKIKEKDDKIEDNEVIKEELIKVEIIKEKQKIYNNLRLKSSSEVICDVCGEKLENLTNLRKHMSANHLQIIYPCPNCDFVFNIRGNLLNHLKQIHLQERAFQCDICAKSFKAKHHLNNHLKIHGEPKECKICGISLPNIEAHIKRHSEVKKKSFMCQQCGKKYSTKQVLSEHIQRIHERKILGKIYSCPQCEETFIRNSDLRRHSFVHYQGKIFTCAHPGCSEMFKNCYKLDMHQIVHKDSIEKKFICEICNKSYPRQTALYKHKKSHK